MSNINTKKAKKILANEALNITIKQPKKPVEALLNYLNSKSLEQGEFYITQSTKPL